MKNHRDVCFATEAGFVEYDGLPGTVKTGCPNSPSYESRYCKLNKPLVVKTCPITCDEHDDEQMCDKVTEIPMAMILSKRITRRNTLYQVFQFTS